jgi:macrolide transport system ATP-binding/permease protein
MKLWRTTRAWMLRIAGVFSSGSRTQQQRAFADEIESHLQMHIDDNMHLGMSAEQARREAILKLGGMEMTKQSYRERNTLPWMDDLFSDLRFALRQLRRSPGFAITAILMLTIGISASVAMFAFVDAALLKPLPYRDPSRIASVTETVKLMGRANLSYPDYLDWKRGNKVFDSLDIYQGGGGLLNTPTGALPVSSLRVTDGFFKTLGVVPVMGRDFRSGEDLSGTANIVILSYPAWMKWFNSRPDVVGQKVSLDGIPQTIIGVLPKNFDFAPRGGTQFFQPFHAANECDLRRSCHGLEGIARLKDGVSMGEARAAMQTIAGQLEQQYPDSNRGQGAAVDPLSEIIVGDIRPILLTLLIGAGLLLTIACVNVASLLLVRSESRRREIAVRGALGASRLRLIRQFLTEGVLLVSIGSLLGVGLAYAGMIGLPKLVPEFLLSRTPFLKDLGMSSSVVLFAASIALFAVLLFALTPTLRVRLTGMQSGLASGLADGGRGGASTLWRRFGANLVVLELAIAVVLLVGAGLLGKSLYKLLHVEPNFNPNGLATLGVMAPDTLYPKDADNERLHRKVIERISALPGVVSVGITSTPPLSFNGNTDWIRFVGRPYNGQHNEVNMRDISADYMKTLQAKLIRGRFFAETDDASRPKVTIINKTLADMYFPGQDPIGQRFGNTDLDPKSIKEIVGVVDDIREGSLESPIWPAAYYPMPQDQDNYFTLMVRTSQSPASILPTLVSTIHSIDPGVGTADPITMEARTAIAPSTYLHRASAWVVSGFAVLALVLGVVGLYGVIAYSVSQRTREIGVRMALGAQRGAVQALVMREAGRLAVLGIGLGLLCAVGAATLMRSLLFGTAAWDVWTLASVASLLAASALVASYIPAHRAASVNPVEALRAE